ncbi:hypothetical protein J1N35_005699 [Gossypium stocksii]|uniref:Uncharacterized protein n=1 Tax=Gossypium stocksii TaxID=47602 RepID=A0A9D4AIU8_9ROSI|nr:hypothetical protein J1N35_005699 [Gossypium stocksii]
MGDPLWTWSASEALKISYSWAKQYASWNKKKLSKWRQVRETIPWKDGLVQLNTNGAIKKGTKIVVSEEVLWDHTGKWIIGFNRYLGECLVLEVEL